MVFEIFFQLLLKINLFKLERPAEIQILKETRYDLEWANLHVCCFYIIFIYHGTIQSTGIETFNWKFRCLYFLILSYWISLERYLLNCFFFNQQHKVAGRKCFEGKFLFLLFDRELLWKLLTSYNTEFKDTHILEEVCHVITVGLVVLYPSTTDKNQLLQILLFDGKT